MPTGDGNESARSQWPTYLMMGVSILLAGVILAVVLSRSEFSLPQPPAQRTILQGQGDTTVWSNELPPIQAKLNANSEPITGVAVPVNDTDAAQAGWTRALIANVSVNPGGEVGSIQYRGPNNTLSGSDNFTYDSSQRQLVADYIFTQVTQAYQPYVTEIGPLSNGLNCGNTVLSSVGMSATPSDDEAANVGYVKEAVAGAGGGPGGDDTQFQYNDGNGGFAGSPNLTQASNGYVLIHSTLAVDMIKSANVQVTANIDAGNVLVESLLSAANVVTSNVDAGNVIVESRLTAANIEVTSNVDAGNVLVEALLTAANVVTSNVDAGNVLVEALLTAANVVTSNVDAGNVLVGSLLTSANIEVTSNVNSGNVLVEALLTAANVAVTSNVDAGNVLVGSLLTSANIEVTSNVNSGNVLVGSLLTAANIEVTSNVNSGNVLVESRLTAANVVTSNVDAGNVMVSDDLLVLGNGNVAGTTSMFDGTYRSMMSDGYSTVTEETAGSYSSRLLFSTTNTSDPLTVADATGFSMVYRATAGSSLFMGPQPNRFAMCMNNQSATGAPGDPKVRPFLSFDPRETSKPTLDWEGSEWTNMGTVSSNITVKYTNILSNALEIDTDDGLAFRYNTSGRRGLTANNLTGFTVYDEIVSGSAVLSANSDGTRVYGTMYFGTESSSNIKVNGTKLRIQGEDGIETTNAVITYESLRMQPNSVGVGSIDFVALSGDPLDTVTIGPGRVGVQSFSGTYGVFSSSSQQYYALAEGSVQTTQLYKNFRDQKYGNGNLSIINSYQGDTAIMITSMEFDEDGNVTFYNSQEDGTGNVNMFEISSDGSVSTNAIEAANVVCSSMVASYIMGPTGDGVCAQFRSASHPFIDWEYTDGNRIAYMGQPTGSSSNFQLRTFTDANGTSFKLVLQSAGGIELDNSNVDANVFVDSAGGIRMEAGVGKSISMEITASNDMYFNGSSLYPVNKVGRVDIGTSGAPYLNVYSENYPAVSDERVKDNIQLIGLEESNTFIHSIRGRTYELNGRRAGLIAQEVYAAQQHLSGSPEIARHHVSESTACDAEERCECQVCDKCACTTCVDHAAAVETCGCYCHDAYTLEYNALIPYTLAALQAAHEREKSLLARLDALEAAVTTLINPTSG